MNPETILPGIVRTVDIEAEAINAKHRKLEAGLRSNLDLAAEIGRDLIKAKRKCKHGEWIAWVEENLHFSRWTAANYMKIAKEVNGELVPHLGYRDALSLLSELGKPDEADEPEHPTEDNTLTSIFRYPGGKTRKNIQDWIKANMPEGCKEYREPFVGGGGIFFGTDGFEKCWLNDLHSGLVAVYQALIERPDDFIAKCREIEPAKDGEETESGIRNGTPLNKRLKEKFAELAFSPCDDEALRYLFINRTVFGGRVNYDIPSRLHFSNPGGWDIVKTDRLEKAAKKLAGVKVTCGDYSELFDAPGEDVWIYADPPYMVNSGLSKTSQLYQHNFTYEDHERFAEVIKRCKHKVCISYDDDPDGKIRSLFEGWCNIVRGGWTYCGTTNGVGEKEVGKELLILHNYRTAGVEKPAPLSKVEKFQQQLWPKYSHEERAAIKEFVNGSMSQRVE